MKLEKWKNKWKKWSNLRKWQIWKLKLIDARLYFVSIFVGLLTGLVAVPYHYLLWYFFDVRKTFFTAHYPWYWHVLLFFILWGILIFVASLVKRMPLIAGGGIPQTRAANNGRIRYEHPFKELVAKFCGGGVGSQCGAVFGTRGAVCSDRVLYRNTYLSLGTYSERGTETIAGCRSWCGLVCRFCCSVVFFFVGDRIHRAF